MRLARHFLLLILPFLASGQIIPGRFIVELAGEPAAVAAAKQSNRREAADNQRMRILAEQQPVRRSVQDQGGHVLAAMDTVVNALAVESAGDAASLASIPGVARVYPVRRVKAALDRAIPLQKVLDAWERIGGMGKAGLGIKIGILDTGIDATHLGFDDPELAPAEGFPKFSSGDNETLTNAKIIVARSYEDLGGEKYGVDARDRNGHGTNAAMAAAGVPLTIKGVIFSGVAPKAYLGIYKVLGDDGAGGDDMILKGIDDAVKDGMDVLNLSLGTDMPANPADDPQVKAVEAACAAGVIVAAAAGNAGPDVNTINSPGTAVCSITVGSSSNGRKFSQFPDSEPIDRLRVSEFSSRGPNLGSGLKPDLLAIGDNFLTADTTLKPDSEGFTITQGTSFATPFVAGAAALVKGARKGLTVAQYRSLIINSANPLIRIDGEPAPIRFAGSGILDVDSALRSTMAAAPTSVNFGTGGANPNLSREITLTNLGAEADTFAVSVVSFDRKTPAAVPAAPLQVQPGASGRFAVRLEGTGLQAGEYHGIVRIRSTRTSREAYLPYWYAVPSGTPAAISLLEFKGEGAVDEEVTFGFRVVDASGIALTNVEPSVTVVSGDGELVRMGLNPDAPGAYGIVLKLGPEEGENVFEISAGPVKRQIKVTAEEE